MRVMANGGIDITDFLIREDALFRVEHCYSCSIPGYLIVAPRMHAESIADLAPACLAGLGPVLALATRAILEVVAPLRVYCVQLGEEDPRLHFHVFPRTRPLTEMYLQRFPEQRNLIHGPLFLEWARQEFGKDLNDVWNDVADVVGRLRKSMTRRDN